MKKNCLLCDLNIRTIIVELKMAVKSSLAFILAVMFESVPYESFCHTHFLKNFHTLSQHDHVTSVTAE